MIATWIQSVTTRPANLPSRNSVRETGFERMVKMVRRSTSLWIRPTPTRSAIAAPNKRIEASPTSCRIRSRST